MEGATIVLTGERTRLTACQLIQKAPNGWVTRIDPPRRTLLQNDRFWAICSDMTRSAVTWGGDRRTKSEWHDLLVSGWLVAERRAPRLLIGLEGELVGLSQHTREMSKEELSSLIDYCTAWAVMHGVDLRE